jgi:hypothetical protein
MPHPLVDQLRFTRYEWSRALRGVSERLLEDLGGGGPIRAIGDSLRRVTYHYWFHIGEILAIRRLLGHRRLPAYVGDLENRAPYGRENGP